MPTPGPAATDGSILRGIPAAPGVACGPALVVGASKPPHAEAKLDRLDLDPDAAIKAYDDAVAAVAERLVARAARTSGPAAQVLAASAVLARDTGLRSVVLERLRTGDRLLHALQGAVEQFAEVFAGMGGVTAERATDLRDIGQRLAATLVGAAEPAVPLPEQPAVLVAEELTPIDAAGLEPDRVLALVTAKGGPAGHTSIIARQLGIPCVVAVAGLMEVPDGAVLLVDGTTGDVVLTPDPDDATAQVRRWLTSREALQAWMGPGATSDDRPVKILANVSDGASARSAAEESVEGAGLFRTELCFLDRRDEPTVAEQADAYAEVMAAFGADRTVVVRTLDAGSDKPVGFASPEPEDNPALGLRGVRVSQREPGLLERQLEAVAMAAHRTGARPWVMAPMVATVAEAAGFAERVHAHGLTAGVMVEVPSAALQADRLLEKVDFLSIGTNDLAQYAMAADRTSGALAHLTDPWQPAVLALVAMTAEAGRRAGKPVGVCGEAAADPALATVLVGMGVTSLSMGASAIRPVGARLATVSLAVCEQAARAALAAADPLEARERVRAVLERADRT